MGNAEPVELVERGVVVFDGFVSGFEVESWHCVEFLSNSSNSTDSQLRLLSVHKTVRVDLPVDGHVQWSLPLDSQ